MKNGVLVTLPIITVLLVVSLPALYTEEQQLSVKVWTNKGTYYVGELVSIYFRINVDSHIKVTLIKPNQTMVLLDKDLRGGVTYELRGIAGCPPGVRTVIVEAFTNTSYAKDTTEFEVKLVFVSEIEITILENYTARVFVKYSPYITPWDFFYSECYNKYKENYHTEQVEVALRTTGVPKESAQVIEKSLGVNFFYTTVKVYLNHSQYCDVKRAILSFKNAVKEIKDRILSSFAVICTRGINSTNPPPSSSYVDRAIWHNPQVDEFQIVSNIYVYILAKGLPEDTFIKVYVDGKCCGTAKANQHFRLSLQGGKTYVISVEKEVSTNGYLYACGLNKVDVNEESTLIFKYSGPFIKVRIDVNIPVKVDATVDGSLTKLPKTLWAKPGDKIVVEVPEVQNLDTNTRILFKKWSDEVTDKKRTLKILKPIELTLIYVKQYLVSVEDPIGKTYNVTKGEGWYDEGSFAELAIKNVTIYVKSGERYVFKEWSGNIKSKEIKVRFKVEKPVKVSVRWKHQYQLMITTEHSNVILSPSSPDYWYDEGTTVKIKINATEISDTPFTGYKFKGWLFEDTGNIIEKEEITLKIDRPIRIKALWERTYNITMILIVIGIGISAACFTYFIAFRGRGRVPKVPLIVKIKEIFKKPREMPRVPKAPAPKLPPPPPKPLAIPKIKPELPPPPPPEVTAPPPPEVTLIRPIRELGPITRENVISMAKRALEVGAINEKQLDTIMRHPLQSEALRKELYTALHSLMNLQQLPAFQKDKKFKIMMKIIDSCFEIL